MRVRKALRWLLISAAVAIAAAAFFHADLLRSAFLRNPIPRSADSIARGRLLFQRNCAVCHGTEGRGDGAAAGGLSKKPEDLSRIAPPPIFPDGVVAYRIIHGKRTMPAFGQTLSENEIWDLMNFIRSLAPAR